jgi:hypothetical protein
MTVAKYGESLLASSPTPDVSISCITDDKIFIADALSGMIYHSTDWPIASQRSVVQLLADERHSYTLFFIVLLLNG